MTHWTAGRLVLGVVAEVVAGCVVLAGCGPSRDTLVDAPSQQGPQDSGSVGFVPGAGGADAGAVDACRGVPCSPGPEVAAIPADAGPADAGVPDAIEVCEGAGCDGGREDPPVCTPTCWGKHCGDDGCGGSCGQCRNGAVCQNWTCPCVPSCSGKGCGDDGCGGSCGTCSGQNVCQGTTCVCVPQCAGQQCGGDGCGGSCGGCGPGLECSDNVCVCQPQCANKQCGGDGCGTSCGACESYQQCSGAVCIGWRWEAESDPALGHDQGKAEADGWACTTLEHSPNFMVYGPWGPRKNDFTDWPW